MKKIIISFSAAFISIFFSALLSAADNPVTETKDAIVHDIKTIKEKAPNDFKEVKKEAIRKKNYVKKSVTNDLKEGRENLKKPLKPVASDKEQTSTK